MEDDGHRDRPTESIKVYGSNTVSKAAESGMSISGKMTHPPSTS